jgi:GNAT superfamily N-acetyltransferase
MSTFVRPYEASDRDPICQLMAALQDWERQWAVDRVPGETMASDHVTYLLTLAQVSGGETFVALNGDQIVGFLVLIAESEDEDDAHLIPEAKRYGLVTDLYVLESARGKGVGALLLKAAEAHANTMGLSVLRIQSLTANSEAIAFYEGRGYAPYELTLSKRIG